MAGKGMDVMMDALVAKVSKLTQGLKEADKTSTHMAGQWARMGGGGGGNGGGGISNGNTVMQTGANFGASGATLTAMGGTVGKIGNIMTAVSSGMPGVQNVLNYASGYYTAGRASGQTSRKLMEAATFSATKNGMTSAGADANMAAMLTSRGMTFNPSKNSTYMQTATMAAGLARMTNVPLEQQAASLEQLTAAGSSSNLLKTFGIFTADPTSGKEKSMTQIFGELSGRLGVKSMTLEGINDSIRRGSLSQAIPLAFQGDPIMQANFADYLRAQAGGDTAKYGDPKKMGKDNPMGTTYDLFASETKQFGKSEDKYIQGMKDVLPTISALNDAFGDLAATVGNVNSALQTYNGSKSGNAINQIIDTIFGGGNKYSSPSMIGWASQSTSPSTMGVGGNSVPNSGMNSMAIAASSMSYGVGGDKVGGSKAKPKSASMNSKSADGKASNTNKTNTGFVAPVSGKVTARLGQMGQYWNKNTGHLGTDFAAPQGTEVRSIGDGEIKEIKDGGELGKQVFVSHPGGFVSHYCHLSSIRVTKGKVSKGQAIASSGNTGSNSHGAHLHFVLYQGGSSVDPFLHIPGLVDGSGAGKSPRGSGSSTDPSGSSSGATDSAGTVSAGTDSAGNDVVGNYIGASSLMGVGFSGISVSNQTVNSLLGLPSAAGSGGTPEALNGARLAAGPSKGTYQTNAPSSKTGTDYVANDGPVNVHAGEAILNANDAEAWRRNKLGQNKGGGTNVSINVNVQQASEAEAIRLANMVKQILKNDRHLERMGSL